MLLFEFVVDPGRSRTRATASGAPAEFTPICLALTQVPARSLVLDGEVVVPGADGLFEHLLVPKSEL